MPLLGAEPLFDATLARLRALTAPELTWVVSARHLARATRASLRAHPGVRLLLEPVARDTAAAFAWAAAQVAGADADAVLGLFPADHHIPSAPAFARTVRAAARVARREDVLVIVGIEPRYPEPALGYLRLAGRGPGATWHVDQFVEKPDLARARTYARSGRHLWNAGMLVARASVILDEVERLAPEVWGPLGRVLRETAAGGPVAARALERAYRRVRPISFDYAVLERSDRVLAVRGRFRWSDLGSWSSLAEYLPRVGGNRVAGERPVVAIDAADNLIWNDGGRALALVGVRDLVVVQTPDAVLVCPRARAQDVRRIVEELEKRNRGDLT